MKRFSVPARFCIAVSSLLIPYVCALAERLPIKIYTPADGLAHEQIKRIVRDSRGFLWFCTADGLSRFDGYGTTILLRVPISQHNWLENSQTDNPRLRHRYQRSNGRSG